MLRVNLDYIRIKWGLRSRVTELDTVSLCFLALSFLSQQVVIYLLSLDWVSVAKPERRLRIPWKQPASFPVQADVSG